MYKLKDIQTFQHALSQTRITHFVLSERTNVPIAFINNLAKNKISVSLLDAKAISHCLSIPFEDLFEVMLGGNEDETMHSK